MDEEGILVDHATVPWGIRISDADFGKLKLGLEPRDMDDHWAIYWAEPEPDDSDGDLVHVHICRGYIGRTYIILHIRPSDAAIGGTASGVRIESITWAQRQGGGVTISEEQGKKEAVILSRGLLGCDFEELPHYPNSDMWTHPGVMRTNIESK